MKSSFPAQKAVLAHVRENNSPYRGGASWSTR